MPLLDSSKVREGGLNVFYAASCYYYRFCIYFNRFFLRTSVHYRDMITIGQDYDDVEAAIAVVLVGFCVVDLLLFRWLLGRLVWDL